MNPLAWWHARSQAERFDISFRSSFYVFLVFIPLLIGSSTATVSTGTAALIAGLLAIGYTVLVGAMMHAGIEHYLGRRDRPTRLLVVVGAVTALGSAVALHGLPPDGEPVGVVVVALVCTYIIGLATLRSIWPSMLAIGAGIGVLSLAVAVSGPSLVPSTFSLLFTGGIVLLTYRSSLWMLRVVWELDRARTVQAGLAVTEERLRIARDMHDVLGRNLSVIALKAELAAQLAKRGRDEAVEEMLEVRRIAQDALTDVRAVVGGYRSAGLDDELAGARSLLASAGIEARIIGDGHDLPPAVQGALAWVVREAVTNVLRHSEAHTCTITLRSGTPGTVTLTMSNDGVAPGRVRFGSGLLGLTERIATLGGTLSATYEKPQCFLLTVTVPLT
ncbi:two-component system sensor histidine kinase DesK [Catenuloplanes nepalensis]|uniref:Two-component system sensor histidine kinase DesK n=1 Tax=Catenuloplanes nepalensis TaxID=587533 RepID=A0ABT9MW04_9ACTN|nr:sensor histidine kinase [Catenuloplanes nepalensis]MDP9795627.1 two-component system sensor histidine kinase DesK [Catenuloplanes nepalensis]